MCEGEQKVSGARLGLEGRQLGACPLKQKRGGWGTEGQGKKEEHVQEYKPIYRLEKTSDWTKLNLFMFPEQWLKESPPNLEARPCETIFLNSLHVS